MKNSLLVLFTISMLSNPIIFAQPAENFKNKLTGNLQQDSRIISDNLQVGKQINLFPESIDKKSPFLAGVLSFIVPGAGEFYSGEYLKAGIFLGVEATVITVALLYDKKGDDQTESFQNFANQNWDVSRYAQWTLDHLQQLNASVTPDEINYYSQNLFNGETVNWSILNEMERSIGNGYSHSLPPFGDQQYYELIGKYPQYAGGWNDFNSDDYHDISPNFTYYSGERGKANDFYNVASKAVVGIYINHFLSTLDAVWSAISFNNNIAMNLRVNNFQFAGRLEFIPTFNFKIIF